MKIKTLLSTAVISLLLVTLSQPALAYVYPDPHRENTTSGFQFSPWMIAVVVVGVVAIMGVVYVVRSRMNK